MQHADLIPGLTHLHVAGMTRCISPALPQCPTLVVAQHFAEVLNFPHFHQLSGNEWEVLFQEA